MAEPTLRPAKLQVGDEVRLVSPASPPERDDVLATQRTFESWGVNVSLGDNVFGKYGYLDVPVLGELPLGHGNHPATAPVGAPAILDTAAMTLTVG